jgi:pimeloyl-ACP methyl ester carboxylesterase
VLTEIGTGVRLATREWPGKGPAIVCIHGLTANHTCWESMAEILSPEYRVLAYDLRGRGDSDKPPEGYSVPIHAQDLVALLDSLGLGRVTLFGHSLGANIAVFFASRYPRRVRKLVLVDGGIDVRAEIFDSLGPAIGRLGMEFPSVEMFLQILQGLPMFAGRWNDHLERYFRYDVEVTQAGTVKPKAAKRAIEEEVANFARERFWVHHHRIKCPTLILRAPDGLLAETDCLLSQEEAEALAHAIPRAKLVVIPKTNHYTVLLGRHEKTRRAVRAFLEG